MTTIRTTPNVSISQFLGQLTTLNGRLTNLQQQASTGLRLQRPSDDPTAVRRVLRAEEAITRLEAQNETINAARFRLQQAHIGVRAALNLFVKAESLAATAVQSIEPLEQATLAGEIDSLIGQLEALANQRAGDEYVFSGIAGDRQPFISGADGYAYQGSDVSGRLDLQSGPQILILATGSSVFQPQDRQTTTYVGDTGASAGTATDNGIGQGTLLVKHLATTFAGTSGIAAGTGSADGDTIIGPAGAHQLTIDDTSGTGAFGTVSLNGGPPISFTSADTNLQVTGPLGEIIYVDTTAITPGFSGTSDITATGTLSTDGGATETLIDFSANQSVIDSGNSAITNVDSTSIRSVGNEQLEYGGTADAFAVLRELADDIRNIRKLPEGERQAALSRRLNDVQRIQDHFLNVLGEQSVTLSHLSNLQTQTDDTVLELRRQVSETASADIVNVAISLQQTQSQLQYTLATASRLFDTTLLDFLR